LVVHIYCDSLFVPSFVRFEYISVCQRGLFELVQFDVGVYRSAASADECLLILSVSGADNETEQSRASEADHNFSTHQDRRTGLTAKTTQKRETTIIHKLVPGRRAQNNISWFCVGGGAACSIYSQHFIFPTFILVITAVAVAP
jgi:hypothetical protein